MTDGVGINIVLFF